MLKLLLENKSTYKTHYYRFRARCNSSSLLFIWAWSSSSWDVFSWSWSLRSDSSASSRRRILSNSWRIFDDMTYLRLWEHQPISTYQRLLKHRYRREQTSAKAAHFLLSLESFLEFGDHRFILGLYLRQLLCPFFFWSELWDHLVQSFLQGLLLLC